MTLPELSRKSQWTMHWTPGSTSIGYSTCDICGAEFSFAELSFDDFYGEGSKCPKCGSKHWVDVTPPEEVSLPKEEATGCSECDLLWGLKDSPPRIVHGKSQWTIHWTPRGKNLGKFTCDICGAKFPFEDVCGENSKCPKCGSSQYADAVPPEKEVVA